ncbi:putative lipoprotein YmbA [Neobacillus niacini]|nr:putative lipoprotein YmbA [Neobacillus niacini]
MKKWILTGIMISALGLSACSKSIERNKDHTGKDRRSIKR